jgi:hypothetical protein
VNFRPASFRRFVRDITRGPDDLIVPADDLTAVAEAVGVMDEQQAEYAAAARNLLRHPCWRDELAGALDVLAEIKTATDLLYVIGDDT